MAVRKLAILLPILTIVSGVALCAELPRKAPEFQVHMVDGKNLSLSTFRQKITLVAFLSTTCPHCQHYVQILNGINKDYAAKGVQIVGAAFDDGAQSKLPAFLQQFQPTFPLGWDDHTAVLGFMQISILNPGFVPKVVFIGRGGTIVKQFEGTDDFFKDPEKSTRATLYELLKAPMSQHRPPVKRAAAK